MRDFKMGDRVKDHRSGLVYLITSIKMSTTTGNPTDWFHGYTEQGTHQLIGQGDTNYIYLGNNRESHEYAKLLTLYETSQALVSSYEKKIKDKKLMTARQWEDELQTQRDSNCRGMTNRELSDDNWGQH